MSANELTILNNYIMELKALEAQIKELEAECEATKDLIKEAMSLEGLDEIHTGGYKVTYRNVISNRFDSTSFKKSHADLYDAFVKQTSYKRLTIN